MDNVKQAIEAILFTCNDPITAAKIQTALPDAPGTDIKQALKDLKQEYETSGRAFTLESVAGGWQLLTRPEHADILAGLKKAKAEKKLSAAALESLAIIAYKQPIKRVDLEAVRGVQSGELIRALMERGLVRIAGRDTVPGSPLLYGTSKDFLETFGLKTLEDLPKPEEVK